jgi:hypothetical protein
VLSCAVLTPLGASCAELDALHMVSVLYELQTRIRTGLRQPSHCFVLCGADAMEASRAELDASHMVNALYGLRTGV